MKGGLERGRSSHQLESPHALKGKILFVGLNPPATDRGGDAGVRSGLIRYFVDAGYDIAYLYLDPARNPPEVHELARQRLRGLGISRVEYVEHRRDLSVPERRPGLEGVLRKICARLFYSEEYYSPWREMAVTVKEKVEALSPDCCFLYMVDTCAALAGVTSIPKVLGIGVFPHMNKESQIKTMFNESKGRWLRARIDFLFMLPMYLREAREALASVDAVCAFAKNTEGICRQLIPGLNVRYLTNPIPDERTTPLVRHPATTGKSGPFRISLVGQLRATATLRGLDYFASQIVPLLRREGVFEDFQFEIIGKFTPPRWLKEKTNYPNIVYTGFVEDLQATIESADVFLVPTADNLGNRSRIVSAWSIGCCVVCHANSKLGMPELIPGRNCLMGDDARGVAQALLTACRDHDLNQRLRNNGRADYERLFAPDVSAPLVLDFMEETMRKRAASQ